MADSKPIDFKELLNSMGVKPAPVGVTADELAEIVEQRTPLIVTAVYYRDVENFGGSWDMVVQVPDGEERIIQMWANVQRDATLNVLVDATKQRPVSGIIIKNVGREGRPFYVPTAG